MSADSLNTRVAIQASMSKGPRRVRESGVKWGSPAVYLVALVLIAICITPVLYIIIGGFRTNSQITLDPSGLPAPGPEDAAPSPQAVRAEARAQRSRPGRRGRALPAPRPGQRRP